MYTRNVRVLEWKNEDTSTHRYGSAVFPFALVAEVDGADTLLRLYEYKPSAEDIRRDYGMWKCGAQLVAASLFTSVFNEDSLQDIQ